MRTTKIILTAAIILIAAACSTSKKSSASTVSSVPVSTTPVKNPEITSNNLFMVARSSDGIYAPGNEELTAIQTQYKDVTLDKLKEGHVIYTQGACIKCHSPMSIYSRDELQWKNIIEDMAQKAEITDVQKDAVYKYVLSIKVVQSK